MDAKHTKLPWVVESDGTTIAMAGQCVIVAPAPDGASNAEMRANAAHIVRCVNSHADLIKALELIAGSEKSCFAEEYIRGIARTALAKARP